MAIRIRSVDGHVTAICAAHSVAKQGDIYLDDAQDHALRVKIYKDLESEGALDKSFYTQAEEERMSREETK